MDIRLGEVMMEAIKQDNAGFVSTLLFYGFPIQPCYTLEATLRKAKGALACYIQEGWDINEPVSEIKPPVLSYAVRMIIWLLDHGADPNKRYAINCIPLSYPVQLAPISIIELMLSRGGDVRKGQLLQYAIFRATSVKDANGRTVMEWVQKLNQTEVVRLLQSKLWRQNEDRMR